MDHLRAIFGGPCPGAGSQRLWPPGAFHVPTTRELRWQLPQPGHSARPVQRGRRSHLWPLRVHQSWLRAPRTCGKHPTAHGRYDGLYTTAIRSTRVDIGQAS